MRLHVTVTAEDIAKGKPGSTSACAIARAIRRLPGWRRAEVDPIAAYSCAKGDRVMELPRVARDFIRHFDRNVPVEPFSFTGEVES